jgi:hypothetical protein
MILLRHFTNLFTLVHRIPLYKEKTRRVTSVLGFYMPEVPLRKDTEKGQRISGRHILRPRCTWKRKLAILTPRRKT